MCEATVVKVINRCRVLGLTSTSVSVTDRQTQSWDTSELADLTCEWRVLCSPPETPPESLHCQADDATFGRGSVRRSFPASPTSAAPDSGNVPHQGALGFLPRSLSSEFSTATYVNRPCCRPSKAPNYWYGLCVSVTPLISKPLAANPTEYWIYAGSFGLQGDEWTVSAVSDDCLSLGLPPAAGHFDHLTSLHVKF